MAVEAWENTTGVETPSLHQLVPLQFDVFHVADARTHHRGELAAVGIDEQDALGEQRRSGGIEGNDSGS